MVSVLITTFLTSPLSSILINSSYEIFLDDESANSPENMLIQSMLTRMHTRRIRRDCLLFRLPPPRGCWLF